MKLQEARVDVTEKEIRDIMKQVQALSGRYNNRKVAKQLKQAWASLQNAYIMVGNGEGDIKHPKQKYGDAKPTPSGKDHSSGKWPGR
mgnify:CR=1 FL=1